MFNKPLNVNNEHLFCLNSYLLFSQVSAEKKQHIKLFLYSE